MELWSELAPNREEKRKVEVWADGRIGYADSGCEHGGTRLGDGPLPSFDEIAADPEFEPHVISASEFQDCWTRNVR